MEKLKPHQRKLWRRIYLGAFESGLTTKESADMAHHAVQQWEDVGAFDDESATASSFLSVEQATSIIDHAIMTDLAGATTITAMLAPITKETLRSLMSTYENKGWVVDERPAPMHFGHYICLAGCATASK